MAFTVKADINGNGYYRVKNYGSNRWASLVDNTGSVDVIAGDADFHSLALTKDTEYILSDPGSIVYLTNVSGNQYDVAAQGTSLQSLVDNPIKIRMEEKVDGEALYRIYGTYKNASAYIADGVTNNDVAGEAFIFNDEQASKYPTYVQWIFEPLKANSNNYYGAVPSVFVGNQGYTTLFTSFAYAPYSTGVKAFYVGRIGFGMVEMIEINGAVPPASPVIIQCAGKNSGDNRMEILQSQDALPNNSLTGVYFDFANSMTQNRVKYNPQTMRVLGVCKDGSLGFVTASDLSYIPANTAYLTVTPGSLPEFKCVTSEEYMDMLPEAPEQIYFGNGEYALQAQDDYIYTGSFEIPAQTQGDGNLKIQFSTSNNDETIIGPYSAEGEDVTIKLPSNLPFQYGNDAYWVLPGWEGGNISISLNIQYQSVSFSDTNASIESIVVTKDSLKYIGYTIYAGSEEDITLFDLSGKTILKGRSSLDLSNIPKGIYVAKSGTKSIKVAR